ncbi:ABC transporter permease [Bacillus carboniphilus]|uniref:ABC transporter permease n=1 Tax=Bacillus carboniphilus TaxID=86663 RepID=A0ABY9JWR6_9BACI|nr:oligopeptide ABC transporter permease [Bacillus carboniphilus]WLR42947.1 ABC transporter permease [Bacillus carboniphilus]
MSDKQYTEDIKPGLFEPAKMDLEATEKISKPSLSYWQDAWLVLRKNKAAVFSAFILILVTLLAAFAPLLSSKEYDAQNISHASLPPKVQALENISFLGFDGTKTDNGVTTDVYEQKGVDTYYWFGTDSLGRDLWTRVWMGTRVSLYIAFLAALIDMVIGVAYGGISGYYGGRVDNLMQRFIEILTGIPNLVIVILMILVLKPGILSITIAIALTGWISMSRVVRGQFLKYKNMEFVLASKTLGLEDRKIISKHLIPNVSGVIIINTMFSIPSAIFFEAFLSFIGLGLQEPNTSLGVLVEDGYKSMQIHPHILLFPAIVISIIMICFNLLADGFRDAFDPKMRD